MAITTSMATSFKSELLQGIHNFHNGSGGGTLQVQVIRLRLPYTLVAQLWLHQLLPMRPLTKFRVLITQQVVTP